MIYRVYIEKGEDFGYVATVPPFRAATAKAKPWRRRWKIVAMSLKAVFRFWILL